MDRSAGEAIFRAHGLADALLLAAGAAAPIV